MQVIYNLKFKKQYQKLRPAQKERFAQMISLFVSQPHHPNLYNHPLTGQWRDHRSISFGGDWRAHYKVVDKNTALFVAAGTHSQLYK